MDIRTMQYYLAVVREGTISAAAQALHVAQPSLSRQMSPFLCAETGRSPSPKKAWYSAKGRKKWCA